MRSFLVRTTALLAVAVVALTVLVSPAFAAEAGPAGANSPARKFLAGTIALARRDPNVPGYCWNAAWPIQHFVMGYEAYGDTAWLDCAEKYFDAVLANLRTGEGGYRGWIVPYSYDANWWCDMHVTDAILVNGLLGFAEVVLKDDALKARYGGLANEYVALAKKDLFEKWDSRGTWHEDGPCGSYVSWDQYCKAGDPANWTQLPAVGGSGISLPYNQQNDVAVACLRLFRITGEDKYRQRAQKLFAYMKSRFQLLDDHYCWNYWEPFGPWDVDMGKKATRHWIGTHPYRDYQASEISQLVEAYHTGVVFDESDIRRLVATNLKVMWNGSLAEPNFVNSNVTLPGYRKPSFNPTYPTWAGTLWTGLADFDPTVRDLWAAKLRAAKDARSEIELAYLEKVIARRPPGFARKYAPAKAEVFDFPLAPCSGLVAACALPGTLKAGDQTILLCRTLTKGKLEIDLYSPDGKTKLQSLYSGQLAGDGSNFITTWDVRKHPAASATSDTSTAWEEGPYRIRWTFGDQYREQPIQIGK
jgi:hypothetical protein